MAQPGSAPPWGGGGRWFKSSRADQFLGERALNPPKNLVGLYYSKIVKSLLHLEYSYNKAKNLKTSVAELSEDQLETWDGFAPRFARSSDLFLSKYIKAYVSKDDPAFDGGFRDYLNRAEKLELIDSVDQWLDIRDMRNVVVHEYSEKDLEKFFEKLIKYSPLLLELRSKLADASQ